MHRSLQLIWNFKTVFWAQRVPSGNTNVVIIVIIWILWPQTQRLTKSPDRPQAVQLTVLYYSIPLFNRREQWKWLWYASGRVYSHSYFCLFSLMWFLLNVDEKYSPISAQFLSVSFSLSPLSDFELKLRLFPSFGIKYRVPTSSEECLDGYFSHLRTHFSCWSRKNSFTFSLTLSFSFYLFGGADFPLAGHRGTNRERLALVLVHTWLHRLSLQCVGCVMMNCWLVVWHCRSDISTNRSKRSLLLFCGLRWWF